MIFYEAPHKLLRTLKDMLDNFGNRKIVIIKELTKIYENVSHFLLEEAIIYYNEITPKGEYVLILENVENLIDSVTFDEAIKTAFNYINNGISRSDASKLVAAQGDFNKNQIYKELINTIERDI